MDAPNLARLSALDGLQGKIAPRTSGFLLRRVPLSLMGLAG
jgi:hypothetical protein